MSPPVLIEIGILSILPQDAHVTLSYLPKMAKVQHVGGLPEQAK
jgi:hypothetical protein